MKKISLLIIVFATIGLLMVACGSGDPQWDTVLNEYETIVNEVVSATQANDQAKLAQLGTQMEGIMENLATAQSAGSLSLGQIKRFVTISAQAAQAYAVTE